MSGIVYSTESGEIEIGVCFCSDMDEEPQSTDQTADIRRGKEGRKGGSKARGRVSGRYRSGPGSCSPVSCHR